MAGSQLNVRQLKIIDYKYKDLPSLFKITESPYGKDLKYIATENDILRIPLLTVGLHKNIVGSI